jgi:hypothetical protein
MGRQSGNIFRTTISVPKDLKARMDAAGGEVNWSAVAVRAFEERLAEIASKKQEQTMDDVIQRLRASKMRGDDEAYRQGEEAGRSWAGRYAEAHELKRLADLYEEAQASRRWDWVEGDALGIANHVLARMQGERSISRTESEEFWDQCLGERYPEGSLLEGFVAGASGLWGEVRDRL